jgi:23S rRNA (cytosine1962-C5)-methyltransferase
MSIARVSRRGQDRIRAGHPWIYRSDVASVEAEPGDIVRVVNERDRRLGWALFSSASQIALRMISTVTSAETLDERAWLSERIAAAAAYRASLAIDATAYRLVNGEADRLPALVVDRYGDDGGAVLVVQTLTQGMDRRLALITELLVQQFAPRGVLARNDPKVRRLEGLDEQVEVIHGDVPDQLEVRDGALRMHVDVRHGQKTGLFLDQRENHAAAARYARGRALDAFAYHGGFAMHLASRAASVIALDSSAPAIAATLANARLNGLANIEAREVNVFDELRELETGGERFDTIVLDPPAFAKNKASVERAMAGYKEINLRALRILAPGGHLVTCSCSYNVSEEMFMAIIEQAAADAHATVALVEKRLQSRDHPVLVGVPETHYLKCFVLRKLL